MLNKVLIILAIFSIVITKHKVSEAHKKNIKRISENEKSMHNSEKNLEKHRKVMKNDFKKVRDMNKFIKRHGSNIEHKKYNKLLEKYGKIVKSYNKNRKSVCAKLPPLWAFVNKKRDDYTPLEYKCKEYYYQGQLLGNNLASFEHKINGFRSAGSILLKKLKDINRLVNIKKGSKNIRHIKKCYLNGYGRQINFTLTGLKHKNKRSYLIIKNPFKSYKAKKKELKKAIRRLKKK